MEKIKQANSKNTPQIKKKTDSAIKAAQAALIKQNLACGPDGANGVPSPAYVHALRQFQAMLRLPVTGKLDQPTSEALGIETKGGKTDED
jgi:peptidoglycan hydrolase-like protein with peptidoglycan-binding domain